MASHSFGYMTVIAIETLIVAVLALCVWYLARQLRSLRVATSEKLSSTTAKALAHFMEECELPLPPERPVELPNLPEIAEQSEPSALPLPFKAETEVRSAPPPPVKTETEARPAPSPAAAGVEAEVQPTASRKRRQCSHRRRSGSSCQGDAGAAGAPAQDLRARKTVRSVDEAVDEETAREAQIA